MTGKAKFAIPEKVGAKIWDWTIINGNATPPLGKRGVYYLVECRCGKQVLHSQYTIRSGRAKRCIECARKDFIAQKKQAAESRAIDRANEAAMLKIKAADEEKRLKIEAAIEFLETHGYSVSPPAHP